ncbi:MAG TPA: VRR-NUC domain-containing protein [Tissierellales bacterium]|nr:VRR-NUC domain-containing protein [Tissierellales bacterium]
MRESKVEQELKKKVEQLEGLYLKFNSPGTNGVPDRIVLLKGQMYFVELKAPGKKPRKLQSFIHNEIRSQGFEVHIIDNLEGVAEFIERIGGDRHEV